MKTHKFARKPFYVDAVRVSEANIAEVAEWCEGTVEKTEDGQAYVKVKVHRPLTERQCQAFVGDWVLFAGTGYKVYTPKAFDKSFEKVKTLTKAQADEAGIKVPHEPRPKIGAVGLAFKDAEAKKGPVPTTPKARVIENAEIRDIAVVNESVYPEANGFNVERVKEAIEDSEGVEVEIAPGVTGIFESQPSEIVTGDSAEVVMAQQLPSAFAPSTTPQFSEIAVTEKSTLELSEEEKQANADAAIADVLGS